MILHSKNKQFKEYLLAQQAKPETAAMKPTTTANTAGTASMIGSKNPKGNNPEIFKERSFKLKRVP